MAIQGGLTEEQRLLVFPKEKGGEKVVEKVETGQVQVEIDSPAHLWLLGHMTLKFTVRTLQEAASLVGEVQDFFKNIEKGYAKRIAEVEEIQRRVTPGQLEMLNDLAERVGERLPENIELLSKTQAGLLIRELLAKASARGQGRSAEERRARKDYKKPAPKRFKDEEDEPATPAQKRYLRRLIAQADEEEPDWDSLTKSEASRLIEELQG